jgi:RNA polymerase sigma-70 factor (ECF subfamily)
MWVEPAESGVGGEQKVQRDLVIRAQQGDAEAFSLLAAGAIDRLHGVAHRILRDQDRADDATQQALVSAWDHLRSLRDPDSFDAWTYRLVVRAAYREARRDRTRRDAVRQVVPEDRVVRETSDTLADRDEIERAFRTLSPEHRAILTLRYYADLPFAEIAEILGIPIGTVGSRLYHATRRMREALRREQRWLPATEHVVS